MSNKIYQYHNLYKMYDMSGIIDLKYGQLMVHDIFDDTPDFMKQADFIFCDPPCSNGNLHSFYSKAEKEQRDQYSAFFARLCEVIAEIDPKTVAIEVFKSNEEAVTDYLKKTYPYTWTLNSMYYRKPQNVCWVIMASTSKIPNWWYDLDYQDEEKIIEGICKYGDFDCIGDPCMGKGLVAYYATKYKRRFVGTELDEKRLGVAVHRCVTEKRGSIN